MTEGLLPTTPLSKPLKRVSPSRFVALRACALRESLAAARVPELLPSSPSARLGTVIHRLLEDAGAGRLGTDPSAAETRWEALLRDQEAAMSGSWLERHFAPLRESIGAFDERRLQALARAKELSRSAIPSPGPANAEADRGRQYGSEIFVRDGTDAVGGSIDRVAPSADGPVLRDYKTGVILDPNRVGVKTEYAEQLQLYAALYADQFGTWPTRLELVALSGVSREIALDRDASKALLHSAIELRERVNERMAAAGTDVDRLQFALASPSPANCRFCRYRPICQPYHRDAEPQRVDDPWPADCWGTLTDCKELLNGRLLLRVAVHGDERRIRGVTADAHRHPALAVLAANVRVEAFSLRKLSPQSYEERRDTVLYAGPAPAP